jgi:myo-inositol-1(or 4)-monophosphatase
MPGAPTPALDFDFDYSEIAHLAGELATSVGERIRSLREQGVDVAQTKSSLTDVVTAADHEAERLLVAGISAARPDDGILGEEGADTVGTSGITWVIDPIDGTVNYLYGLPAYAVSVAATVADDSAAAARAGNTHDGRRAIAGAIYLPVSQELFVAAAGGGATRNGAPIAVSRETDLSLALVGTGFGYTVERRTEQAEVAQQVIPQIRDLRRMGSASVDLCMIAAGRLDAYYERGLQPWDYAAGALIAREAGALVLGRDDATLPGEPLLIAGPPALASRLQQAVAAAYAARS